MTHTISIKKFAHKAQPLGCLTWKTSY